MRNESGSIDVPRMNGRDWVPKVRCSTGWLPLTAPADSAQLVSGPQGADEIGPTKFDVLPERVQEALGELAGAAKEGLLALSVGVGVGVLAELMAEEVDDVVGPKASGADHSGVSGLSRRVSRPP
jgi:hypothetical protein